MDPRLLEYYNQELQHIREMGGEFAREFPKIAGRLGLEGFECADPYVERLLEGFAFLAARVQLKLDAQFPGFAGHLFEMVYPHFLAPIPSMTVVQFQPDLNEGALGEGFSIPRGIVLRSNLGKSDQTSCEYRSAHDVTLWPLELAEAEYFRYTRDKAASDGPEIEGVKAGLRLQFRTTAGFRFADVPLESIPLFLRGSDELPMHLYEQVLANVAAIMVRPTTRPADWYEVIPRTALSRMGFREEEALLPECPRSFLGYRLLQEYFAFPDRFMFVELGGLGRAFRRCNSTEVEVVLLLDRSDPVLENVVNPSNFALFCSPAINLFPKRADRIHLSDSVSEYHVVPDRTRPMDFEVYQVNGVTGHGTRSDQEQEFLPFYACNNLTSRTDHAAYHTVRREARLVSSRRRRSGPRSSYVGNEVFVSLVDPEEAPYSTDLRQLSVNTLCTNRDLPLHMPVGQGRTDFTMESGAPVESVRCLSGPTKPRPTHAEGETAWRLISHLSLNYLSLMDSDGGEGAAALRDLLMLYGDTGNASIRKQITGVKSITSRPITRRMSFQDRMAFIRGLEITVTLDEAAFEGTGVFLLGGVLEQFFDKYVSINSFTKTVVRTLDRGEIIRWPARIGRRHTL